MWEDRRKEELLKEKRASPDTTPPGGLGVGRELFIEGEARRARFAHMSHGTGRRPQFSIALNNCEKAQIRRRKAGEAPLHFRDGRKRLKNPTV